MAHQIDLAHYDGRLHAVPFIVGADFFAKWEAYRADGFTVSIDGQRQCILACKIMPGEPIPSEAA